MLIIFESVMAQSPILEALIEHLTHRDIHILKRASSVLRRALEDSHFIANVIPRKYASLLCHDTKLLHAQALLEYTTIVCKCFCCHEHYADMRVLREHLRTHKHTDEQTHNGRGRINLAIAYIDAVLADASPSQTEPPL